MFGVSDARSPLRVASTGWGAAQRVTRGVVGGPSPSQQVRDCVRSILEKQLAGVDSPDLAAKVVQQAREAARGVSEASQAEAVSRAPGSAVMRVARAGRGRSTPARIAAMLVETASQGLGSTAEAPWVAEAAYDVLGSGTHRIPPAAEHGRSLLRAAAIVGLGPLESLEARVFLGLSCLPHPGWLHALCEGLGGLATGGGIWIVGVLGAYLLRIEGSDRALKLAAPIIILVGFVAERPAKAFFAPRRPFQHRVGMMLLGGKPRGCSFPSGHAATSFAGAWILGCVWPRCRPAFLGLATLVSLSRVYLGAHDPRETAAGTLLGVALAEALRRPAERLLARVGMPQAVHGAMRR
jgi:undecaprenyl-diphosphatase